MANHIDHISQLVIKGCLRIVESMASQFKLYIPTIKNDSNVAKNDFVSHAKTGILEFKIEGDRKSPGDVSEFFTHLCIFKKHILNNIFSGVAIVETVERWSYVPFAKQTRYARIVSNLRLMKKILTILSSNVRYALKKKIRSKNM